MLWTVFYNNQLYKKGKGKCNICNTSYDSLSYYNIFANFFLPEFIEYLLHFESGPADVTGDLMRLEDSDCMRSLSALRL